MSELSDVKGFVARKISIIQNMPEGGSQKAILANLRRGIGRVPGDMPEVWGIVFRDLPESLFSRNGEPTRAEWAIYSALTLYALHQQSRGPKAEPMHVENVPLGRAVRRLAKSNSDDDLDPVRRRFNRMATSDSMEELTWHLRGIVQLLKSEGIPLDYVRLAEDIYRFQFPNLRSGVRLMWGQDFYYTPHEEASDDIDERKDESNE